MIKTKLEKKRFMKVYEELFNTDLSPNAVLLLSFLIDKEPLLKKTEGYYRIPTEFIQNSIGWSSHIIRNTLEELEEYGLIEVQVTFNKQPTKVKSGVCKSRYVKFNEEDIVKVIGEDNDEDNVEDNVKKFDIYHSNQSIQSNQINQNIYIGDSEESKSSTKKELHKYGEFQRVKLTDDQYQQALQKYGKERTEELIKEVDEYCAKVGKTYKNYLLAMKTFSEHNFSNKTSTTSTEDKPKPDHYVAWQLKHQTEESKPILI